MGQQYRGSGLVRCGIAVLQMPPGNGRYLAQTPRLESPIGDL
jgi:hypothetical protein